MEKLKVGDRAKILNFGNDGVLPKKYKIGEIIVIKEVDNGGCSSEINGLDWWFDNDMLIKVQDTASQSKQIKQALKQICLSGTVIKSEKIIDKVKQKIGTGNVFGDTILRGLRQLRSDGVVDYTADKQTREYTFK